MGKVTFRDFDVRDRVLELRREFESEVPDLRCPGEKWGVGRAEMKDIQLGAGVTSSILNLGLFASFVKFGSKSDAKDISNGRPKTTEVDRSLSLNTQRDMTTKEGDVMTRILTSEGCSETEHPTTSISQHKIQNTDVKKTVFSLEGLSEAERLLVNELLNPEFGVGTRRRISMINPRYQFLLDPFLDLPYPLNCLGTFARIPPDYLESFVNIGRLINLIRNKTDSCEVQKLLRDLDFVQLRMALRRAIHVIGDISYDFEWADILTYSNINTLLEEMAIYTRRNKHIADSLKNTIYGMYQAEGEIVILDIGSGIGGTSIEILYMLQKMIDEGLIPSDSLNRTKLLLLDVSDDQLMLAKQEILKKNNIGSVELFQSNFRNIGLALQDYVGRIDVVISGAAVCHATQKYIFFKELYGLIRPGGIASIWDPAISQYQGHFLRMGKGVTTRVHFITGEQDEFIINKGELLDIEAIRLFGEKEYSTVVEIPQEEIAIFIAMQGLHLFQMGFSEANIGKKMTTRLKEKLHSDILLGAQTPRGFSLIDWYRKYLAFSDQMPQLKRELWTPYDLIEAVEDKASYEAYVVWTGFRLVSSKRFSEIFEGSPEPSDFVTAHYLFVKPE